MLLRPMKWCIYIYIYIYIYITPQGVWHVVEASEVVHMVCSGGHSDMKLAERQKLRCSFYCLKSYSEWFKI